MYMNHKEKSFCLDLVSSFTISACLEAGLFLLVLMLPLFVSNQGSLLELILY